MVADELRRQADQFIDLADLEQVVCRDQNSRPPPRQPAMARAEGREASPVRFDDLGDDYSDDI